MAMPVLLIAEANLTEEVTRDSRSNDAFHTSRQGLHLQAPARPSHRAPRVFAERGSHFSTFESSGTAQATGRQVRRITIMSPLKGSA
jgi:hypothetical protein